MAGAAVEAVRRTAAENRLHPRYSPGCNACRDRDCGFGPRCGCVAIAHEVAKALGAPAPLRVVAVNVPAPDAS